MQKKNFIFFKIMNVIGAASVTFVIIYGMFIRKNMDTMNDTLMYTLALWLTTNICNSANNLQLLNRYSENEILGRGRKIFFWIIYGLFVLITIGVIVSAIALIVERFFNPHNITFSKGPLTPYLIVTSLTLVAIYISIAQPIVFIIARKNYRQENDSKVNDIGSGL